MNIRYRDALRHYSLFFIVATLFTASVYFGIDSLRLLNDTKNIVIKGLVTKTKLISILKNKLSSLERLEDHVIIEVHDDMVKQINHNIEDHLVKIKTFVEEWHTLAGIQEIKKVDEFILIFDELTKYLEETLRFHLSNANNIIIDLKKAGELFTVAKRMIENIDQAITADTNNKIYLTAIPNRIIEEMGRVSFDEASLISLDDMPKIRKFFAEVDSQLQNIKNLIDFLHEKIASHRQHSVQELVIVWGSYLKLFHNIQQMVFDDGKIQTLNYSTKKYHTLIGYLKRILENVDIDNQHTLTKYMEVTHHTHMTRFMLFIGGGIIISMMAALWCLFSQRCRLWQTNKFTRVAMEKDCSNKTITHLLNSNWNPILDNSQITPDEILNSATAHKAAGRLEEAAEALSFLTTQWPDHINARIILIQTLIDLGCHGAAILQLEKIMGNTSGALGLLAECYRNAGLFDRAEELLRKMALSDAINTISIDRWMAMIFGKILIENQRWNDALNIFTPLTERPELADVARTVIADVMYSNDQLDTALNILQPVAWSNWSRTFVLRSVIRLRQTMTEDGRSPMRRPHPYPGSDIGMSLGSIGYYGRFGHQLNDYLFLRWQADRLNIPLETPEWVGHYIFELDDPLPTGRRILVKRLNTWIEEKSLSTDTHLFLGRDFFSPGGFTTWRPEYTLRARALFRLRPYCQSQMMHTVNWLRKRGETIIACHIRRTDFITLPQRLPNNKWYIDWLRNLWPSLEKPILYVASDDLKAVRDDFAEFAPLTVEDVDNVIPGLEWLHDFVVLMHADVVAISQSSFSHWACILNTTGNLFVQPDMGKECLVPYSPLLQNLSPVVQVERN